MRFSGVFSAPKFWYQCNEKKQRIFNQYYYMKSLKSYFQFAIKSEASDIHLVGDEKPYLRVHGVLQYFQEKALPNKELEVEVKAILTAAQKKQFEETLDLDLRYGVGGVNFRVNVHRQDGKIGLSARLIPNTIPSPEEIGLADLAERFTHLTDGLILVVGPTGHGKSTTIASMIEQINQTRKSHIITVEDPIEFIFEDKQSLIEQREIGIDTVSFASALKHVLRQDPDVILVGEMRDPETIATALTAAETGHLVFSTLHTSSAADAVERIVDVFEGPKQKQVLIQLGSVLRGIVAQQLIPTVDGKRAAAREILVSTPAVGNLIRENNVAQLKSVMQTGARDGMVTMENAIKQLLKEDIISDEEAKWRLETLKM